MHTHLFVQTVHVYELCIFFEETDFVCPLYGSLSVSWLSSDRIYGRC